MRLLVLGGTAFLGHEISRQAVVAGDEVVCLARGVSGAVPQGAAHLCLDRDEAASLEAPAEEHWDAVVDVGRVPTQVASAARLLSLRSDHYVFVSTGNVYADTRSRRLGENAARLAPLRLDDPADASDPETYGRAKVACEDAVVAAFGEEGCTLARAGLIGGPGDVSGRTGYWPWRLAHPSNDEARVLVPAAPDWPVQIVDVRDLAAWLLRCARERIAGAFNAVGHTSSLAEALEVAADGARRELVTASAEWLAEHDVTPWMGPRSLPLWVGDDDWAGFCDRDNTAALDAGLTLRPDAELFRDAGAWELTRPTDRPRAAGLSDADERDLLARLG